MEMVKVSSKVSLNPRDIVAVSDTLNVDNSVLINAVDLSKGAKRTAVFMSSGVVFLIELKVDTFMHRLTGTSRARGPKNKE